MKLTYIYHSCYAIESDNFTLIIDFYKDTEDNLVKNKLLNNKGRLYILSTHSHHDHFVPEILEWKKQRSDIVYIFSKDILDNGLAREEDAVYLDKLETYTDDYLTIKAYGSTDIGGSFLIEAETKLIYHAGDLNNWHWNEEVTKEEADAAETFYLSELALLAHDVKHIHLAMFPIDPRLGKDYMKGAEQFVSTIKTDIFVPMHFYEMYHKIAAFESYAQKHGVKYISWKNQGQSIHF